MVRESVQTRPLNEREASVLQALIYEYITTGKPVGSRSFVQKYSFSISPATMRNIMFDLESMEYLKQPHTSAGRIPTDIGYRFYVNSLLDNYDFSLKEREISVKEEAIKREVQLDKIFSVVTRMLSSESRYAAVMLTPRFDFTVVKRIVLVPMGINEILFILVTRTGMVLPKKVTVSANVTQDDMYAFSAYLTEELSGYAVYEIMDSIFDRLRQEHSTCPNKDMALDIAQLAISDYEEPRLHIEGIENLLKIPEMVEEERLNSLLSIIEDKSILKRILEKAIEFEGIRTLIGEEVAEEKVKGCSMVSASYKIGNKLVGAVGVIGPTRMDYEKVVPLVDYTGRVVTELLTKMSK
ncbi:MAG TPA: heat-inducible transcriptional repressor HrcA [Spirochaetota bacterium]|mgnify:CR=1 FL=1|nr:heat-inducible transcriptional repressor HrcA [Spirochaetota bacterium]HPG49520.1 heat-inducible transcriptional repressor HrcA [Spirochaetota bacterium]HQL83760.1 heat-inducible transcriptional repressor HrcA [Spirochaetota bacterium]